MPYELRKSWLTPDVAHRLEEAPKAPDGVITMMFTDIVSSSAIKPLLSRIEIEANKAWHEQFLEPHNELICDCLARYDGFKVKTMGDAFFITFADPVKAVHCAVEIQNALKQRNLLTPLPKNPPLQVRIGLHTGLPLLKVNDYIGTSVDFAARVESIAEGGQIIVSDATYRSCGRRARSGSWSRAGRR